MSSFLLNQLKLVVLKLEQLVWWLLLKFYRRRHPIEETAVTRALSF
jgi:hypothetical protein